MLNLNHKKLNVWKRSIELVTELYEVTKLLPDHEKFGLVSQLRRAAVSISSNISEGAARKSKLERKRFFEISRSSLVEIDTQIEIALVLNYLSKDQVSSLNKLTNETFAMLSSLTK
ncbi:four helix bundle protein [Rhodohalobacter sp. 614A]|uniref:four helix bundle protein n=1 Tax=Rhodohalobacter sp. 614A TaxID=2908649 RepID=UPI001F1B6449|nr:four helix bundle protein [Rhodohalobacter sp. 614A]